MPTEGVEEIAAGNTRPMIRSEIHIAAKCRPWGRAGEDRSEGDDGLDPEGIAFRAVLDGHFLLVLH